MDKDRKIKERSNMMRYSGLAFELMAAMLAGVWLGQKTDGLLGWKFPLFLILLPLAALCFSLWRIIREVSRSKK